MYGLHEFMLINIPLCLLPRPPRPAWQKPRPTKTVSGAPSPQLVLKSLLEKSMEKWFGSQGDANLCVNLQKYVITAAIFWWGLVKDFKSSHGMSGLWN